jgi:hypothetical protein
MSIDSFLLLSHEKYWDLRVSVSRGTRRRYLHALFTRLSGFIHARPHETILIIQDELLRRYRLCRVASVVPEQDNRRTVLEVFVAARRRMPRSLTSSWPRRTGPRATIGTFVRC